MKRKAPEWRNTRKEHGSVNGGLLGWSFLLKDTILAENETIGVI